MNHNMVAVYKDITLRPLAKDDIESLRNWSDNHNELYALPKGFAINCLTDDYLLNNIHNLNAKYLAVT